MIDDSGRSARNSYKLKGEVDNGVSYISMSMKDSRQIRKTARKEIKFAEAMLSSNLPNDVMVCILCRLPVKSLLRLKRVSKFWCAFITKNHYFITEQLERNGDKDYVILVKRRVQSANKNSKELCVFSLIHKSSETGYVKCIDVNNLPFLKGLNLDYVCISPPCNGIVCVTYWSNPPQTYLWNPSVSGEFNFKALPLSPIPRPPPEFTWLDSGTIGFGLDRKTNGYKVVRIWTILDNCYHISRANKVEVCRLSDDFKIWREIDATPLTPLTESYGNGPVYANGKCYWKVLFSMPQKLVSFDFGDEVFEEIELPNAAGIAETDDEYWQNVVELNDMIALISYPLKVNDKCFEVWLMKNNELDDGGSELSWTKYTTVEMPHSDMRPLRFCTNGDVVLQDDDKELHLCTSTTGVVKTLEIEFDGFDEIVVYNESLVSFKQGDMLEEYVDESVL